MTKQLSYDQYRLGYQVKGWSNRVLGLHWVVDFNNQTKAKARGRWRLIALDGHDSHINFEFLMKCKEENIIALCYPANSTHIYQGLDVACFSVMKTKWAEACRKHEHETGGGVMKDNFLAVFGQAYVKAFTPATIKAAFSKTGLYPVNRNCIQPHQLAPSKNASTSANSADIPILPSSSPVKHLIGILEKIDPADLSSSPPIDPALLDEGTSIANRLSQSGNEFLFSSSPITSSDVPTTPPKLLSLKAQPSPRALQLLQYTPKTEIERNLLGSLKAALAREDQRAKSLDTEQSKAVVNALYTGRLQKQLKHKEEKKQKKNTGKLKLGGHAVHLTSDQMLEEARLARDAKEAEDRAAEQRRTDKVATDGARKKWKEIDDARKERNRVGRAAHKASMEAWKAEVKMCKLTKRPLTLSKPNPFVAEKEALKSWLMKDRQEGDVAGDDDVEMAMGDEDDSG